jgi:hypothetical protein
VTRTIAETTALVTSRERRFAEHGISSMTAYRLLRGAGNFTDDHYGDVFLLVDGWATVKTEFEPLEAALRQVLPRMLNYGCTSYCARTGGLSCTARCATRSAPSSSSGWATRSSP